MKASNSSHTINTNTSQSGGSHIHNQVSPQNSQKQQNPGSLSSNPINSSSTNVSGKPTNSMNGNNNAMPPPPGVNMINPQNNQFMMGLPFVCAFILTFNFLNNLNINFSQYSSSSFHILTQLKWMETV